MTLEQLTAWINFFRGAEVVIGNGQKTWTLTAAYLRSGEPVCVLERAVPGPHPWSLATPIKRTVSLNKVRKAN